MKKWGMIIGTILLCLIGAGAGGAYLWFQYTAKKCLPQISGEIRIPGLHQPVEILRDTYGVPHIYAQDETDLYFGFGYAMAQDRLWQMEFTRRLGQGRLAEIFGEDFVRVDKYFHMLTAAGINSDMPPQYVPMFAAFTNGINAYINDHMDRLPIEFTILRYTPEPWQANDYIAAVKVITWALSSGWRVDLMAGKVLKKVGEAQFKDAFPPWPGDAPLIIPQGAISRKLMASTDLDLSESIDGLIAPPAAGASNNWVVSGKKSQSGKPMLANDTHLPLTNPSFWWEVHLVCPTIDVCGFAATGIPGIPIGQNRHVAWGITNVMVDDVDFYIEKINPDNPRQYWNRDHWADMTVRKETIAVKGKDPVEVEFLLTHHGPIVTDGKNNAAQRPISARWAFTDAAQPVRAGSLLMKAEDVSQVIEALRYWEAPGQNFVFADTKGNIGYWCATLIPIRTKSDGLLPVPGWTGEYDWAGYVPFEKKPHLINPEAGFIATANNKVTDKDYPYRIGRYWEPTDRITRIVQLLTQKETLSVDDFKQMHMDVYCPLASKLTPKIIEVLERQFSGPEGEKVKTLLSGWDYVMDKTSPGACLFEMIYWQLMEHTFKDELEEKLFMEYLKSSVFPPRAISAMVISGDSPWFDDVTTAKKETLDDMIALSVRDTLSELNEALGDDMTAWQWGEIHTLIYEHVLGKKKPLNLIFNLGPFPVSGNPLTVNKKKYPFESPYTVNHGVSMRLIVDFSNMDGSLHVLPTGESGQLKSPFYRDQIPLYLSGRYQPGLAQSQGCRSAPAGHPHTDIGIATGGFKSSRDIS
ncbi:MAG: penicillin acylase family protein [Deltaproteobacteria bacterium]|nr:penicillin acylase family protein [Deltaproteobacteria bacterium]